MRMKYTYWMSDNMLTIESLPIQPPHVTAQIPHLGCQNLVEWCEVFLQTLSIEKMVISIRRAHISTSIQTLSHDQKIATYSEQSSKTLKMLIGVSWKHISTETLDHLLISTLTAELKEGILTIMIRHSLLTANTKDKMNKKRGHKVSFSNLLLRLIMRILSLMKISPMINHLTLRNLLEDLMGRTETLLRTHIRKTAQQSIRRSESSYR